LISWLCTCTIYFSI